MPVPNKGSWEPFFAVKDSIRQTLPYGTPIDEGLFLRKEDLLPRTPDPNVRRMLTGKSTARLTISSNKPNSYWSPKKSGGSSSGLERWRRTHEYCDSLAHETSVSAACYALNVSRCALRWQHPEKKNRPDAILRWPFLWRTQWSHRCSPWGPFVDKPSRDLRNTSRWREYFCSTRTMYRILEKKGKWKKEGINYLVLTMQSRSFLQKPNEVWSWDITKLKGPRSGPITISMDSRYLQSLCGGLDVATGACRPAKSSLKGPARNRWFSWTAFWSMPIEDRVWLSNRLLLMADLGVTKVIQDHPSAMTILFRIPVQNYEVQTRVPERFGSIEDARAFCQTSSLVQQGTLSFGMGLNEPEDFIMEGLIDHWGSRILYGAYAKHPERFKHRYRNRW